MYGDQIEDYLNDLEDARKSVRNLKSVSPLSQTGTLLLLSW